MDPVLEKAFNDTQKKWPLTSTNIEVQAYEKSDEIFFKIGPASLINPNSQIYFFPDRSDVIKHAAEQILKKTIARIS